MRKISDTYYMVHYGMSGHDCAHCYTLEDAESRKEEIRQNQLAHGYTPDETQIYLHAWEREIDDKRNIIIKEIQTKTFIK